MSKFAVTAKEAESVRQMLADKIKKPHFGIDGSYEEGVIDTITWLLGESPYIANTKHQKELMTSRHGERK